MAIAPLGVNSIEIRRVVVPTTRQIIFKNSRNINQISISFTNLNCSVLCLDKDPLAFYHSNLEFSNPILSPL